MLGPAAPLGGVEHPIGIDLVLEAGEERGPAIGGGLPRVAPGVQEVGGKTSPKSPLTWGHILNGQRGRARLIVHRRRSFLLFGARLGPS